MLTTEQKKVRIIELRNEGKTYGEIRKECGCSLSFVYCALTGKTYKKHNRKKEIPLRGLSQQERVALKNIAKNKDRSVNRLLLTYVRIGISQEPKQNLVYED